MQKCGPSTVPGAKTRGGAGCVWPRSLHPSGIDTRAIDLRGTMPRLSGRMPLSHRQPAQSTLHFTLNQDSRR